MDYNEKMEELLNSECIVRGYVYRNAGREEYCFQGTAENIAFFLARFPDADRMILTDAMDRLVLNTFGYFIDTCPNKQLLEEVRKYLVPIQMGEKESGELFFPTMEEVTTYYDTKQGMGWTELE